MIDFSNDIEQALTVLKQGGTILYPTDTVWGLGCDATNAEAVDKIYTIKDRPSGKSMIVLVADAREVLKYVSNLDLQVFDYLQQTEKPTTVIYEGAIGLADNVINEDGSVAIRIVKDDFCRHLIRRLRKPLVSTSANISGQDAPVLFRDISAFIKERVDYLVEHRQTDTATALPSSIIKWKNGNIVVVRP